MSIKNSVTKIVKEEIFIVSCDICGKEIREENECGVPFCYDNDGSLRVQISSDSLCIHATINDICKECSKSKSEELKQIIEKLGFIIKSI